MSWIPWIIADGAEAGMSIPEWGWGLFYLVMVASFSLIAFLLKRADRSHSDALKELKDALEMRTARLPQLWDRVKDLKDREPTIPTSTEKILRQLTEFRIEANGLIDQLSGRIDQLKDEARAVERKHGEKLKDATAQIDRIRTQLWEQVGKCRNMFVGGQDYKEQIRDIEGILRGLEKVVTALETRISVRKNGS